MKRSAALAIWRAIKELRRAKKGVPGMWADMLDLKIDGLAFMLIQEHVDLLDSAATERLNRFMIGRAAGAAATNTLGVVASYPIRRPDNV